MDWDIFKKKTIPFSELVDFSDFFEDENIFLFEDGTFGLLFLGVPPYFFLGSTGIEAINALFNLPKVTDRDMFQIGTYISDDIRQFLNMYLSRKTGTQMQGMEETDEILLNYCKFNAKNWEKATKTGINGEISYRPRHYICFFTFRSAYQINFNFDLVLKGDKAATEKFFDELDRVKNIKEGILNVFKKNNIQMQLAEIEDVKYLYDNIFGVQYEYTGIEYKESATSQSVGDFLGKAEFSIKPLEDIIVSGSNRLFSVYTAKDFSGNTFTDYAMKILLNDPFDANFQLPNNTLITLNLKTVAPEEGVKVVSSLTMKEKFMQRYRKNNDRLNYLQEMEKLAYKGYPPIYGYLTIVASSDINLTNKDYNHGYIRQTVETMLKRSGIIYQRENFRKVPIFSAALPFGYSFKKIMPISRDFLMTTYNAGTLAPVEGDFSGVHPAGIFFITRTGNLVGFDLFSQQLGDNYVSLVIGASGSGKSFLIQSIVTNYLAEGVYTCIIEVAPAESSSYRNSTQFLGGKYIDLTVISENEGLEFTLNPFAGLKELGTDLRQMIVVLLSYMAEVPADKRGWADGIFDRVIQEVFDKKKGDTTIDDIVEILLKDERTKSLGESLFAFTKKGRFGKFFEIEGKKVLNFENLLTTVQIPPVEVVGEKLLNIMYLNTIFRFSALVYSQDEKYAKRKKLAVYDEAHNVIFNPVIADLITKQMRQFRRAQGGILVGTQTLEDFFKTPDTKIMFDNASYKIIFKQDESTLERLKKDNKLILDDYTERLFRGVQKKKGMSEFLLMTKAINTVVRHIGNKYEIILFGSSAAEREILRNNFEKIKKEFFEEN